MSEVDSSRGVPVGDYLDARGREIHSLAVHRFGQYLDQFGLRLLQARGGAYTVIWRPGHPFDQPHDGPADTPTPEQAEAFRQMMSDQWGVFADDLRNLLDRFSSYAMLDSLERSLFEVGHSLGVRAHTVGRVDQSIGSGVNVRDRIYRACQEILPAHGYDEEKGFYGWKSPAADTFNDAFLGHVDEALLHQSACVEVLAFANQTFLTGVSSLKADMMSIADTCVTAFDQFDVYEPPEVHVTLSGVLNTTSLVLTAIGVLVAVPEASVVSFLLGSGSLLTGIGAVAADQQASSVKYHEWHIGGATIFDLILSMNEAVATVERQLAEEDNKLAEALSNERKSHQTFASLDLSLQRQEFVGDPTQFGTVSVKSDVVVEVERLYRVGYHHFPFAAAEYQQAAADLVVDPEIGNLQQLFFFGWAGYVGNREKLRVALQDAANSLRDVGATLVEIAGNYRWSDAMQAQAFQRLRDLVPAPREAYAHSFDRQPTTGAY